MKKLLTIVAGVVVLGAGVFTEPAKAESYKVTFNNHGTVVRWDGGETLSLGKSCDAIFSFNGRLEYGTWNCQQRSPMAFIAGRTISLHPLWGAPIDSRSALSSYQGAGAATAINGHSNTVINQFIQAN